MFDLKIVHKADNQSLSEIPGARRETQNVRRKRTHLLVSDMNAAAACVYDI